MNYQRIYSNLINRRKLFRVKGYTEKHHIVPRCIGGTDDSINIIKLTAREHYIAHKLLIKIYPGEPGLVLALWRFVHGSKKQRKVSSKDYQRIKEACSKIWSEKSKINIQKPEFYAKTYALGHLPEARAKARVSMLEYYKQPGSLEQKSQASAKGWRETRGLKPILVFKAVCLVTANKNRPAKYEIGEFVGEWECAEYACTDLKLQPTKVSMVLRNNPTRKQHKGYIFKYKDEYNSNIEAPQAIRQPQLEQNRTQDQTNVEVAPLKSPLENEAI